MRLQIARIQVSGKGPHPLHAALPPARIMPALLASLACAGQAPAQCAADIAPSGSVDGEDLGVLLSAWGPVDGPATRSDLNADGAVDGADLAELLTAWGTCAVHVPSWASLVEAHPDPLVVTDAALREAIITTRLAWRVRDTATQIEMLLVPSGSFVMGCSPSELVACDNDEFPRHAVTLTQPYYLGRYEVMQAEWRRIVPVNPSFFSTMPDSDLRPVEQVNWNMARDFAALGGFRLPTEAEWEYACRAGTSTAYHNGSNANSAVSEIAWISTNAMQRSHAAGELRGNALGFHDMSGNVWEWVADFHGASYYAVSPAVDPTGPTTGGCRVIRGGAWYYQSWNARSSNRGCDAPQTATTYIGFRVARTP